MQDAEAFFLHRNVCFRLLTGRHISAMSYPQGYSSWTEAGKSLPPLKPARRLAVSAPILSASRFSHEYEKKPGPQSTHTRGPPLRSNSMPTLRFAESNNASSNSNAEPESVPSAIGRTAKVCIPFIFLTYILTYYRYTLTTSFLNRSSI